MPGGQDDNQPGSGQADHKEMLALILRSNGAYQQAYENYKKSRALHLWAIRNALGAGVRPRDILGLTTWTATYIRKLAREAGIPPSPRGTKNG